MLGTTGDDVAVIVSGEPRFDRPVGDRVTFVGGEADVAGTVSAPADLVLLSGGSVVADGWLEGLREAGYIDGRVATASALVGGRGELAVPLPAEMSFEDAAARVRESSLRIRPRLPAASAPCAYVRRSALELVGSFGTLGEYSRRCQELGLAHVLADEVLVYGSGRSGLPEPAQSDAVRRALGVARRALYGLSIAVDARILKGPMNGTKLHVLELIAALAPVAGRPVLALVGDDLDPAMRAMLERVAGVELVVLRGDPRQRVDADVVHRPYQVNSPADLAVLAVAAERLVITQQDLIGYTNPSYFSSLEGWEAYRELTRAAMTVADRVLFFSAHAREEALAEQLVEPERASVVHIGVDHVLSAGDEESPPPDAAQLGTGEETLLCIGTDYRHKNRVFALRIAEELQRTHGWRGRLVFAGPKMRAGSSATEEARILARLPALREAVIDLGEVSEPEKAWLLRRASLVLYPTVYEGFGLVPFEAAARGVPCLWAPGSALSELLPDEAARIVPWDAAASAVGAAALMRDQRERERNVEEVRVAGTKLRWDVTAKRLLDLYRTTADAPPSPTGLIERSEGTMRSGFSEDAVRLVGPDGALPREVERPLLALATHPNFGRPVFGALKAGYLFSIRWRRSRNGSR